MQANAAAHGQIEYNIGKSYGSLLLDQGIEAHAIAGPRFRLPYLECQAPVPPAVAEADQPADRGPSRDLRSWAPAAMVAVITRAKRDGGNFGAVFAWAGMGANMVKKVRFSLLLPAAAHWNQFGPVGLPWVKAPMRYRAWASTNRNVLARLPDSRAKKLPRILAWG